MASKILAGAIAMIKMKEIKSLCERIVKEFKPERVVLFGSYAAGSPRLTQM